MTWCSTSRSLRDLLEGTSVSYQMEKRYFHRDGRVIWVQLSVSVVRRANGEVDFLVAQLQDITERKMLERMKDEFVSVVSQRACASRWRRSAKRSTRSPPSSTRTSAPRGCRSPCRIC